jgi:hypothetical protein
VNEDTPHARVARWTERDAAIGTVAELEQVRARLGDRDRDVANLRERCAQLGLRVTALELERSRLAQALDVERATVEALLAEQMRASLAQRIYRRARRAVGRSATR